METHPPVTNAQILAFGQQFVYFIGGAARICCVPHPEKIDMPAFFNHCTFRPVTILVHGLLLLLMTSGVFAETTSEDLDKCRQAELYKELQHHQARAASSWEDWISRPLAERIARAPDFLVDYIRKDNEYAGHSARPVSEPLDTSFLHDIQHAVDQLPDIVNKQITQHLVGILVVTDLGSTGYCEILHDFQNNELGFIVLDSKALNKRANEWASWKENSAFTSQGDFSIVSTIETPSNDTTIQAIQYILLHELGHLVGAVENVHPNWFIGGNPEDYPFSRISWTTANKTVVSRFDERFPLRASVTYYTFDQALLASDQIPEIFQDLEGTDLCTLYGATNPYDDFAEAYAQYVHVVLMQRPWKIAVTSDKGVVFERNSPITSSRMKQKKDFLEMLFAKYR
jgi:hypothetical protein